MILIHKDPIEFLVSAALLHLSYNCAPLLLTSALVTHSRAGHSVRGSTAPAVGVMLAFDWGLLGARHYGT